MAMEKPYIEPTQASLFKRGEIGVSLHDPRFDTVRVVFLEDDQENSVSDIKDTIAAAGEVPPEGVSLSLREYYQNRKQMTKGSTAANRSRAFAVRTDNSEGLAEAFDRYGSDAPYVIEGAMRNAGGLQERMDELFLTDELMAAGFAVDAVRRASKQNTDDIHEAFVGPDNEFNRKQEYKYVDKKIAEHSTQ